MDFALCYKTLQNSAFFMSPTILLGDRSPVAVLLVLLSGSYIIYTLMQRALTARRHAALISAHGCKPIKSYPHRDPFGLDLFFSTRQLLRDGGLLEALKHRYALVDSGWTFSLLILGVRAISTADPENVKTVLTTNFKDYALPYRRKDAFLPVYGHGIFTTDGKEWEESRALLRPNFTRSHIDDLEVFEVHISNLIARIPKDGSTVDLQKLFFELTLDSATDFLFGSSTNVLGNGGEDTIRGQKFGQAFTDANQAMSFQSRLGWLAYIVPNKKFVEDTKYIHEYIDTYVQKAVKQAKSGKQVDRNGRYVFLDELAKTGYSERKIRDELMNILLAGRDTTAGLLAHLFHILARRPDVWQKLRNEVLKLGDKEPSFEQIKEMKYLQYCLNEALRLHPIVPANSRDAVVDTILPRGGGPDGKSPVFVSKGTTVNYHVYVMHRRKDLFGEDAGEFRPERWETLRPSWNFLPFNGGPRICIGQQFALTEASYTTIRLLQTFKVIEARDDVSLLKEFLPLTLAVRDHVNVGLTLA